MLGVVKLTETESVIMVARFLRDGLVLQNEKGGICCTTL